MAKQIEELLVKLGIEGHEEIARLKSAFRGLESTVGQSDRVLDKARQSLIEYGKGAQQSEALFKGMISSLQNLKAQADVTGPTFRALDADIKKFKADLYGATEAIDKEREALVKNANAVKTNTLVVGRYIGELKKLRSGIRDNSDAAKAFDKDIAALTTRLREMQQVQLKDMIVGSVKGAQGAMTGLQGTVQGAIKLFSDLGRQSRTALGQVARVTEGIAAIGAGGAIAGVGAKAVGGVGASTQAAVDLLTSTKAALGGMGLGVGEKLTNIIPDSAIANLSEAATRLDALQSQVAGLDQAMDGITQAFTAFGPGATAGAVAASAGIAVVYDLLRKKADQTRKELEDTFRGVSDGVNELIVDLSRLGDQLRSLYTAKLEKLLANAQRLFSMAPAGSPLSRSMASQIAGLEATLSKEQAAQAAVLEEYRQRVRGSSEALTDLGDRLAFVQQRLKVVDTSTQEGAREFASLSREALDLTSKMTALGDSYRHVSTMATQAATAQQNAANAVVRQNYLNRGAAKAREEALVELGERVRQGVAATPLALPAAGGTSAPGTGQEISGGARRLTGQVEYTFNEAIGDILARLRDPKFIAAATTAAVGAQPAVGYSYQGQRISSFPEPPKPTAYTEALNALREVRRGSDSTIASLEKQRSAWDRLRNVVDPTSASFRNATTKVQELDKRLEGLSAKQQTMGRRGLGLQGMTQVAGAAISGGIFGGPEGFLGGVAGGALGGVGGAFAGAAIGAQAAMLRQAAGGMAEYAAAINQQRRALSGVVEDNAAYQQSLAFIDQTSRQLAIPQEQITQQFTRLSASVIGAGGNVEAAQEAFSGIAAGIRATGGSLADMDAAMLATAQVFSKGKVSAEEIRGQIGERLPGAFTLFAKSIDKTPQQLDEMLEKGQVTLNDFMSFIRLLNSEFGQTALEMAASSEAAGDRLATAFGRMQEEVGKAIQPIGAQFQEMFADFVEGASPVLSDLLPAIGGAALAVAKNIDVLAASLTALAVGAIANAIVQTGGLTAAFTALKTAILASNAALLLNPWVALAAGIAAATVALVRHSQAQAEWQNLVNNGAGTADELSAAQKRLEADLARTRAQLKNTGTQFGESARDAQILKERIKELEAQLARINRTYTVRIRLEQQGYTFDNQGSAKTYTVAGVTYDVATGRPVKSAAPTGNVFPVTPPESSGGGGKKGAKGPKPPEDRTRELRAEADLFNKTAAAENAIRDALFKGKELKAADLEFQKEELQILHERDKALQAANYEGEKQAIRTMAELKILDATLRLEDRRREIKNALFQAELQNQEAVRNAIEPLKQAKEQQELQLKNTKEYTRLVMEGVLPSEAERIINWQNLVAQQVKSLDTQIQITEEQIAQAELKNQELGNEKIATKDLRDKLALLRRQREGVQTQAQAGPGRGQTEAEKVGGAIGEIQGELNELTSISTQLITHANAIGDAFSEAFVKLITGAGSARQVLSDFFQSVAKSFLDMAAQIIAKQITMLILQTALKALGAVSGGPAAPGANIQSGADFGIPGEISTGMSLAARGAAYGPQGPLEMFSRGGVVTSPTPFRFAKGGSFAPGLLGEAGPEAILPLQRGPDGRLGVSIYDASRRAVASAENAAAANAAGYADEGMELGGGMTSADRRASLAATSAAAVATRTQVTQQQLISEKRAELREFQQMLAQPARLDVEFKSQVINNVEYVTKEQAERMAAQSAVRGREMTLNALQTSVKTRKRVGMGR